MNLEIVKKIFTWSIRWKFLKPQNIIILIDSQCINDTFRDHNFCLNTLLAYSHCLRDFGMTNQSTQRSPESIKFLGSIPVPSNSACQRSSGNESSSNWCEVGVQPQPKNLIGLVEMKRGCSSPDTNIKPFQILLHYSWLLLLYYSANRTSSGKYAKISSSTGTSSTAVENLKLQDLITS